MCWMLARNGKGELEIPKAVLYISLRQGGDSKEAFRDASMMLGHFAGDLN